MFVDVPGVPGLRANIDDPSAVVFITDKAEKSLVIDATKCSGRDMLYWWMGSHGYIAYEAKQAGKFVIDSIENLKQI